VVICISGLGGLSVKLLLTIHLLNYMI